MRITVVAALVVVLGAVDVVVGEVGPADAINKEFANIKKQMEQILRQMVTDATAREERVRAEGDSGLKLVRNSQFGTRPYYSQTYSKRTFAAIHDHSNNIRTVGMGEVVGVINGVQFRTRHNDYRLRMPSKSTKNYHETEDIPFPNVPSDVKNKPTVGEEIEEMQEYFRAFATQNETHRKYKEFFKPVICYMEGAWTKSEPDVKEPFFSDRHFLEAKTWYGLLQKIRMMAYTGAKSNNENYAYLPSKIMFLTDDGVPVFAQWNYRILCHPLKTAVPLDSFTVVDDLTSRMTMKNTLEKHKLTRAARFTLKPNSKKNGDYAYHHGLLDDLMGEVPGKDNYPADLRDESMGMKVYDDDGVKEKNVGFYHRVFRVANKGAMGTNLITRGFNDQNLFMAATTRDEVAPMEMEVCKGRGRNRSCNKFSIKCTWAIPLEIIYLTPLSKWNPYDIEYKGSAKEDAAKKVTFGGRNGGNTKSRAFNGTHSKLFYHTPATFFGGGEKNRDAADTTRGVVAVLDKGENVRLTKASGTRIFLPSIGGMNSIRTRYPIAPVHDEGDNTRKELEVVKDILMNMKRYAFMLNENDDNNNEDDDVVEIQTGTSKTTKTSDHVHTVELTSDDLKTLRLPKGTIEKETDKANDHTHKITIMAVKGGKFRILHCDDKTHDKRGRVCWDQHPRIMLVKKDRK